MTTSEFENNPDRSEGRNPGLGEGYNTFSPYLSTDGRIEDTDTENEMLIEGNYPYSLEEVTTLPSEEDEFHMIDYLMGHSPEEQ